MSAPFEYTPYTPQLQWYQQPRHPTNTPYPVSTPILHPTPRVLPPTPYALHTPLHQPYYPSYHPTPPPVVPSEHPDDHDDYYKQNSLVITTSIDRPPGPKNLQPRPHYWRPDYPNKPLHCPLRRLFTSWNQVRIDPLLHRKSKTVPPMRYDLRVPYSQDCRFSLPAFHRPPTHLDLCQFATDPPLSDLRLWHRRLPWYFDITSAQYHAVTIADVLEQLHSQLFHRITPYDYWTTSLSSHDRDRLDETCHKRSWAMNAAEPAICRIDFLHQHFIFTGLTPTCDGTFQFKTIPFI